MIWSTMIASIEGLLVFVVIVLLSALSNWLKQKKELEQQRRRATQGRPTASGRAPQSQTGSPAQQPQPAPPAKLDWEEQLRRLLEGEVEIHEPEVPQQPAQPRAEPTPRKAVPPPLIPQAGPMKPREPMVQPSAPAAQASGAPLTGPPAASPPASLTPSPQLKVEDKYSGTSVSTELAKLEASAAAYKRAAELAAQTAARLEEIAKLRSAGKYAPSRLTEGGMSPEIQQVREMLRNPRSASQALIASVIFGPPRALRETPGELWAAP